MTTADMLEAPRRGARESGATALRWSAWRALGRPEMRPASLAGDGTAATELLVAFQRCLALKLFFTFHVIWPWGAAVQALLAACTLAMCGARTARLGVAAWWALMAFQVARTLPFTLNHYVLELLVLSVLVVFPVRFEPERQSGDGLRLLWLAVLSVWFFAGIQKLVHGQYLDGRFMALALLGDGQLGAHLRGGLELLQADATSALVNPVLASFGPSEQGLSATARVYSVALGWLVVIAELGLPVLACFPRTRTLAVWGLSVAQAAIGFVSGELDFAITGLALIGLGSARHVRARYATLAVAGALFAGYVRHGS